MIAICSMVRKPFNFDTWIDYHLSLGIDYIFLRVEDTPELSVVLENYKDKVIVEYDDSVDKKDNYWNQMSRQTTFVNKTIEKCISMSIDWIAHIDSDELIWSDSLDVVNSISEEVDYVIVKNYEAVYQNDNLNNPFLESNRFTRPLLAYGNGKSFGRISKSLKCNGPHKFFGKSYNLDKSILILHFESPTFEIWYKKFSEEKSDISDEMLSNIPFEFYKNSIELIREGNIEKCREFYNKMKVDPYNNQLTMKLYWTPMRKEKNSIWTK